MSKIRKAYNPKGLSSTGGRYSHVVRATGKSLLFIAGQVSRDEKGKIVGKGDFSVQAEQVFQNLKRALDAEKASFDDIVKLNIYLTDLRYRDELGKARSKYITKNPPASTLVGVTALADPEYLLEIEAIALVD